MPSKNDIDTPISEIMHKHVITVKTTDTAQHCAVKITEERVGCIIVLDNESPVGIITERGFADLVKGGNFDSKKVTAEDFMTAPLLTIEVDTDYMTATEKLKKWNIKRVPVVEDKKVVGLLTLRNLVDYSRKAVQALQKENTLLNRMAEQRGMTRE